MAEIASKLRFLAWKMVGDLPVLIHVGEPGDPPQLVYSQAKELLQSWQWNLRGLQVGHYAVFARLACQYNLANVDEKKQISFGSQEAKK